MGAWQRPRRKPHARPYDLLILDAPASGQLVGLLDAPRIFSGVARIGPVARQAEAIRAMLLDPGTAGVIAVATPEQMAVTEILELRAVLANRFGLGIDAVVVNRLFPSRFGSVDRHALAGAPDDPAVRDARWFDGRARAQRSSLARLRRGVRGVPITTLPFVFSAELGRSDMEHLAGRLAAGPA